MTPFELELVSSASTLAQLTAPDNRDALKALAFVVRNRATSKALPVIAAVRSLELPPASPAADAGEAFGALQAAFEGPGPDPTWGATHVHRHNEAPAWAARLRATALIGDYLFLAPA